MLPHDVLVDVFECFPPEEATVLGFLADGSTSFEPFLSAAGNSYSFQAYVELWDDHVLPPTRIDAFAMACRHRRLGLVAYLAREAFASGDADRVPDLREVLFCSACREGSAEVAQRVAILLFGDVPVGKALRPQEESGWLAACGAGNESVVRWFEHPDPEFGLLEALVGDRPHLLDAGGCLERAFRDWERDPSMRLFLLIAAVDAGATASARFLCSAWEISSGQVSPHLPSLFSNAVRNGRFRCARWLADEFDMDESDFRQRAHMFPCHDFCRKAESDPLPFAEWLFARFDIVAMSDGDPQDFVRAAFRDACTVGRLDIMRWLRSRFFPFCAGQLVVGRASAFQIAAAKGHVDIVRWLFEVESPSPRDLAKAVRGAARRGHARVLREVVDRIDPGTRASMPMDQLIDAALAAASRGHLECAKMVQAEFDVRWWGDRGRAGNRVETAFREVAKRGWLDVARWLAEAVQLTPAEARAGLLRAERRGNAEVAAFCRRRFRFARFQENSAPSWDSGRVLGSRHSR